MFNNIAFVGGIHGVGKSTICKEVCQTLKVEYLSASDLIKWNELNVDTKNKRVENIATTQDRLVKALTEIIKKSGTYLLDGHYCLLNKDSNITNVPIDTFKQINPISLNLILGDVQDIKRRLEARDNRPYDANLLKQMQDYEVSYAKEISKKLQKPLNIAQTLTEILTLIHKDLSI